MNHLTPLVICGLVLPFGALVSGADPIVCRLGGRPFGTGNFIQVFVVPYRPVSQRVGPLPR